MIIIPIYILITIIISLYKKEDAFDLFYQGSITGLKGSINLIPSLMGIMIAINIFVKSGVIEYLEIILSNFSIAPEIVLQSFLRPISANSSLSIMNNIFDKYGANSTEGYISTIIQGAFDTSFYIITLYYGSLKIPVEKRIFFIIIFTNLIIIALSISLGLLIF